MKRQCSAWALICGVFSLMLACSSAAQAQGVRTAPTPPWVLSPELPVQKPSSETEQSDGAHFLLFDRQVRVEGAQVVEFRRLAIRLLHARGIERHATLNLGFNPAHERLTVHSLIVHRDGAQQDRLPTTRWRTLQRETRLESQMLDGSLSATTVLSDVRVGDVIEYSYSHSGANPVFGGRHFDSFEHRWSIPVARMQARLLWPVGRALHLRSVQGADAPERIERGSHLEYRWRAEDVAALTVESQAPLWHNPYPTTYWSEFADWQAVARWAVPLYALPPPTPRVQAEVNRIAREHAEPEQRLLAALRFVQREVRYLGLFMGPQSHAPNPPDLVLQRRYGDCKDKTRLLLALLHGLGIPAEAALVNTRRHRGVEDWQPMPGAFDHVLVRVTLAGRELWLDPTQAPQPGMAADLLVQADHGLALPVRADADRLVPMAPTTARPNRRHVEFQIDASAGPLQPARLRVTTRAEGSAADSLRQILATQAHGELHKTYADFYATAFEGVRPAGALEVQDEPDANALTLIERYELPQWWKQNKDLARREALISTAALQDWLRLPSTSTRQAPYALAHPFEATHVTEVLLSDDFQVQPTPWTIEHPAFRLSRVEQWPNPRTLRLVDRFESRADVVAAADMPHYLEQLRKARTELEYSLQVREPTDGAGWGLHPTPLMALLVTLVACAWGGHRLMRWDPEPAAPRPPAPTGLAGWLLLPPLGMVINLWLTGRNLAEAWPGLQGPGWSAIVDVPAHGADAWLPHFVLFSGMAGVAVIVGMLLCLWLYLRRRTSLPLAYSGLLGLLIAVQLLELVGMLAIPRLATQVDGTVWADTVKGVISCVLWIAYFRLSGRVANTFTVRRPSATAVVPV